MTTPVSRRELFRSTLRDRIRPLLNDAAEWKIELTKEFTRQNLQLCTAFLASPDTADLRLANRWLRRTPYFVTAGVRRFDIFEGSILCEFLLCFGDKLEPETVAFLDGILAEQLQNCPGMQSPDYQFHGYNSNMPAMAVKTLICGGERLGDKQAFEVGRWKLRRLAEQLSRTGLIAEYNSPNYTPDTLHHLTSTALYARDAECRELAEKCARRIWADLACHYHPRVKGLSAPFSRGYRHDFNNHLSSLNCALWFLFGDAVSPISAMETMEPRLGIEPMHCNDWIEHSARMAWYSLLDPVFLDAATEKLFYKKTYPFEIIAGAEHGDHSPEIPLKKTTATSYLAEDYSLGSASFSFVHGHQTNHCGVAGYSAKSISPLLFSRYFSDEKTPGHIEENFEFQRYTKGEGEISSSAIAITVQHKNAVLVSATPLPGLAEKPLSHLRYALIAPNSFGQFGGFFDRNGVRLETNRKYPANAWYGAVLGEAVAAFHPAAFNIRLADQPYVVLRKNDRYEYLEIVNYHGPARTFTKPELAAMLNGFALEVTSQTTPAAWIAECAKARWEDQFFARTRRIRYERNNLRLMLEHTGGADGSAFRAINTRYAPEPIWQATDVPAESLPFLHGDGYLGPLGLPYENLVVHSWTDAPTFINHLD